MDPLTIATVGSGILSSIFGSSSQKKQLKLQREQFEFQKQQAQAQLELAKEAQRQGLATQIDAAGNVTAYDKATNTWKTILSAEQQALLDASERESLQQLTRDASLSRSQRESAGREQIADRGTSQALREQINDQISGRSGFNAGDIASSLRLARERAVSQGFDDVSNTLATQALRSGAGGFDRIGGALARARAQAIAQTMGDPNTEAMQLAEQLNQTRMGSNANLYNLFASRANGATAGPTVNTTPNTTSLTASRNAAQNGIGQSGSLTGNASSIMGQAQAPLDNTMGNLFSGISNLLASPAGADLANLVGGLFKKPSTTSTGLAGGGVY